MMRSKAKEPLATYKDAYNFALDKLALRDHSTQELRSRLADRQCPEEIQDQVIQKLLEHHFLDDVRCAEHVLAAWRRKGVYGRQYLRLMLQKREIPNPYAELMLDQVEDAEETERAWTLVRKERDRLHRKYPEDDRKGKAALARMLASRGFTTGAIANALEGWNEET
jgi:regulatory protein